VIALASRWAAPAQVTQFQKRYLAGSPVRLVRDPSGAVAKAYGIEYHPRFVAFDAKGRRIGDGYSFVLVLAQSRLGASAR
jgi:hypothetical protein